MADVLWTIIGLGYAALLAVGLVVWGGSRLIKHIIALWWSLK